LHFILLRLDDVTINSRTNRWWNDLSSHWLDRMHWIKWVRLVEWFIIIKSSLIWEWEVFIQWYQHWSLSERKEISFHLLILLINIISFYSFQFVQINRVLINQRFENRERFILDHEINRIINFVYSFNFRNFSTFVWLS
jgi:hypothetical protein